MAHTYDSLNVGDTFETVMTVSAADVRAYADLTGDDNPIHVDAEYAATTDFGQPIAHGALLLGYISKVLGR
ncbi:MAG: MaoC/PaaZ C-terminal domain-containing protein, partial [Bacteroidota bacterium]